MIDAAPSEKLVDYDEKLKLQPALTESWRRIEVASGGGSRNLPYVPRPLSIGGNRPIRVLSLANRQLESCPSHSSSPRLRC